MGVHQTGEANAELHLPLGTGIGCTRGALIPSSFAEECETDLFGEQAIPVWWRLGADAGLIRTLQDAGYSDEVAYIECIHELKQVVDLLYAQGPAAMHKAISNTANSVRSWPRSDWTPKNFEVNSKVSSKTSKVVPSPNALPKMPKPGTLGSTPRGQPTKPCH